MIDQLSQQLQSPDPAQRKSAIIALANSKDPSALKPLEWVYRNDPDPQLRALAAKAGSYIQQANQGQQQAAPPPPPAPPRFSSSTPASSGYEAAYDHSQVHVPAQEVSAKDQKRAKDHYETAMTYHLKGDRARAVEFLGKALRLNPNMRKEQAFMGLAVTVTGLQLEDALRLIENPAAYSQLMMMPGRAPSSDFARKTPRATGGSWSGTAVDLALYWLITTLAWIAFLIFGINGLISLMDEYAESTGSSYTYTDADGTEVTIEYGSGTELDTESLEDLAALSLPLLIGVAAIVGLGSVLGLIIQSYAVHLAATMILKGDNSWLGQLSKYVPYHSGVTLVMAAILILFLALSEGSPDIMLVFSFILTIASLGYYVVTALVVGKAYNFGVFSGCLSIFIGGLILQAFACICGFLMGGASALGGAGVQ